MRPRALSLSAAQRAELEQARDHDQRPYLRERAAALLKIADGQSVCAVAAHGLLRRRQPETVTAWLNRYQAGASRDWCNTRAVGAVFPPQQRARLWQVVHQTPDHFGIARARWRLVDLQHCPALPELADYSLPGICKLLQRLGIRSKRGRLKVHSPDPAYPAKVFALQQAQALARRFPQRVRLLYADEVGCYRQPTLADRYAGHPHEPVAPLSQRANTRWRIGGALDVASGQVTYVQGAVVGVAALCALLEQVRARYPDQILVLAWDNLG